MNGATADVGRSRLLTRARIVAVTFVLVSVAAQTLASNSALKLGRGISAKHTWHDNPVEVLVNGAERDIGAGGSSAAHLRVPFPDEAERWQSYWAYQRHEPVPMPEEPETAFHSVKSCAPLHLRVGISPVDFIYHGPAARVPESGRR